MSSSPSQNPLPDSDINRALSLLGISPPGVIEESGSGSSMSADDAEKIRQLMLRQVQSILNTPQKPIVFYIDTPGSMGSPD